MFRIIGPLLSLLIACAAFFFFVRPMVVDVQALQAETRAYEEAVSKANEFNTLLGSLLAKKSSFSALELDRLETLVPTEIDGVRALVDIEELASTHGLLFDRVTIDLLEEEAGNEEAQPVVHTSAEGVQTLDIAFSVVGDYASFKAFLEDLEESLLLMDVMEIAFQTAQGELITYAVTVRLYGLGNTE